jgi:hypothetical protein
MRLKALIVLTAMVFTVAFAAVADEYDAAKDYQCAGEHADNWSHMAYRASDGEYRELAYDRVPVTEMSKYGIDALYLPDGDQDYRPFFARLSDRLFCSPAYEGDRHDAALIWTATKSGTYAVSAEADFIGKLGAEPVEGSVTVRLIVGGEAVFSSVASAGMPAKFEHTAKVAEGDTVVMRVENAEGAGPKVTEISLSISDND